jgi:hypothetical protein
MASARVLGTEGVRLAESGDCAAAIPKLEAAERLFHAPTTLDRLGECQVSVGKVVAGTESLNRVVREPLAPGAPAAFVSARQRAQQALSAALPRIARLRIHVEGAPADQVTATVDGASVPQALFDADRPTDPGHHEVRAAAAGYRAAVATVDLAPGAAQPVSLTLEPEPKAAGATPEVAPSPGAAPSVPAPDVASAPPPSGGSHRTAGIAALVVGGVGLAAGSVFGVLALSKKSTLDGADGCVNKVCSSASAQSDIDSLKSNATLSTIGFGVGIVGVVVGAVLLATSHEETPGAAPRTASVTPWIGLGAAGVGGTFR